MFSDATLWSHRRKLIILSFLLLTSQYSFHHTFLNWKASEANWRRKIRNYFAVVQCQDTFSFVISCVISVLFAWQHVASSHCIIIHGMKNLELHKLSWQWGKNTTFTAAAAPTDAIISSKPYFLSIFLSYSRLNRFVSHLLFIVW